MAIQVSLSIYGQDQNDWNRPAGLTKSFPTQGISVEALSPAVNYSGVACNTIISVLPTGLNVNPKKYYTPTATATVITACNA